ncbi:MAG: hypothetical protein QF629_01735 [Alphaproteobacteria bacterium]|jgi:hypothetical protein|nr:hypothetical protein [Alphaproteobacteria bacterium]MDP6239188.1 hypothetical protein [Alphaproteobacteria bacterium]MDP7172801.1 hypothetical protein [Alphaproteobacteria bacterium]
MILIHPLALLLLLPAVAMVTWHTRRGASRFSRLPGDWERLVTPLLRGIVARGASEGKAPHRFVLLALWTLLVIAIARPAWQVEAGGEFANIAGRVIAIDLGGDADIYSQRFAANTLIEALPDVPTAIVVGSGDAFNVVPLTTDRYFLNRYLNVIAPDVMPLEGRALPVIMAHAEGVLTRAGVSAGQVVLLTGGEPPARGAYMPVRWSRVVVTDDDARDDWYAYSQYLAAQLVTYDRLGPATEDLARQIDRARRDGDRAAIHDLTPYVLGLSVLLWLAQFRRRRSQ